MRPLVQKAHRERLRGELRRQVQGGVPEHQLVLVQCTDLKQVEALPWQWFEHRLFHLKEMGIELLPGNTVDTLPGDDAVPATRG